MEIISVIVYYNFTKIFCLGLACRNIGRVARKMSSKLRFGLNVELVVFGESHEG